MSRRTVFCPSPVGGSGRRQAAGRRRSLSGRASEPAWAKEPIAHFPAQLCFGSKYNSELSQVPGPSRCILRSVSFHMRTSGAGGTIIGYPYRRFIADDGR